MEKSISLFPIWKNIHYQIFHVPNHQLSNSPAKNRPNAGYPLHPMVLSQGSQASFSLRSLTWEELGSQRGNPLQFLIC
jgi:hypothetical protein